MGDILGSAPLFPTLAVLLTGLLLVQYLLIAVEDFRTISSVDDFFVYRQRLTVRGVFSTFYASGMSLATVFIAFMRLAPDLGVALIWAVAFYALGHLLLWVIIPRIKTVIADGQTIHTFLGTRYGSDTIRRVGSAATVIGFIGVFATELIVGTYIFEILFGEGSSYWAALILFTGILITYALLGGFRSVVRTDIIQSLSILFVTALLVVVAFSEGRQDGVLIPPDLTDSMVLPGLILLNFFLINVFFPVVDMSAWQRVAASESTRTARNGVFPAALFFFVTWSLIVFASLALTEFVPETEDGAIMSAFQAFASNGTLQTLLAATGVAALVAAMMSTADTFLIAASQSVAMDIRQSTEQEPMRDDRAIINLARSDMLQIALTGLFICLGLKTLGFNVAELVFAVYGSSLALLPTVTVALAAPAHWDFAVLRRPAIGSILVGILGGWSYGILAVLAKDFAWLTSIDPLPGPTTAYNAPTVAVLSSILVFVVMAALESVLALARPRHEGGG